MNHEATNRAICQCLVALVGNQIKSDCTATQQPEPLFQRACQVHGMAACIARSEPFQRWATPSLAAWADQQYALNRRRIEIMQTELGDILRLFAKHDLPLMPMKGAILTAHYYPTIGLRPMADLDLLIRPVDLQRAGCLLKELGYQPEVAHWKHTEFSRPDNRRVVDAESEHPDNPRKLELHVHCRERFGGPTVDLTALMWQDALEKKFDFMGLSVTLPQPEALLLHLLVHATYHFWQGRGRLIQIVDFFMMEQSGELVMETMLDLLHGLDARYSYPALRLWGRYFPSPFNEALLAEQRERVSESFHHWAEGLDLVHSSYLSAKPSGLYSMKALKFSEGRPKEVLQAIRFALLPSLEEIALDHPNLAQSKFPWLAYGLLPLDWLRRLR